jgi:translation initiation factor 1 (eIF-1/SUI1)
MRNKERRRQKRKSKRIRIKRDEENRERQDVSYINVNQTHEMRLVSLLSSEPVRCCSNIH